MIKDNDAKTWTTEELARLYQAKKDMLPYKTISLQLGRSVNACEHKWNDGTNWQNSFKTKENSKDVVFQSEKNRIIQEIREKSETKLDLYKIKTDIIADAFKKAATPYPKVPLPELYKPSKSIKGLATEEDAGLLLSDLHVGHKYSLEEMGGLGEYNIKIFFERLENLRKAVTRIVELHSHMYKIPTLHIFLLGDNVHGMNETGSWSNAYIEEAIIEQYGYATAAIADTIYYFLSVFENVCVYGVSGNHGRAAAKGIEKDYVNWDYVAYSNLRERFINNPRVKFWVPKSWHLTTSIRNHRFFAMHGEDVKGSNPISGIQKTEYKIQGLVREVPDYVVLGHFHSPMEISTPSGRILVNGAFFGPDPYSSKSLQLGTAPSQKFFGIHHRRGITWRYDIDLTSDRDE